MKTCKTSDYKHTNMNCSLVIRNKRHLRDVSYTQAMDTHSSMETTLTYTESNVYQGSQTKVCWSVCLSVYPYVCLNTYPNRTDVSRHRTRKIKLMLMLLKCFKLPE